MKIEMRFDDIFLSLIKYIQPKRSGIYKKAFKDIKHELLLCYQIARKEAVNKEKQRKIEEDADLLKFYYCESEDDYFLGKRVDNLYYARFDKESKRFAWCMSRYLPWGEHIVQPDTLWKEHTYPSEPIEIPFSEWLIGFLQKYYAKN